MSIPTIRLLSTLVVVAALAGTLACDESPTPWSQQDGGRADGFVPHPDAGVPHADGEAPRLDGKAPPKDGQPPKPDGPKPDGPPPKPDAGAYPAVYPTGRTQSPITAHVVANLKQIAKKKARNGKVISKIGNSITVASTFLNCFSGSSVDLAGRTHLSPTVSHFSPSWSRKSLCATGGWPAFKALSGSPSPLAKEVAAASPRFAVVMYGSNDIGYKNITRYADNMLDITDNLIKEGVIPLLTTIPPRDDSATANLEVPRYNAIIRAVAQARQVPMIDYHRELMTMPKHGLAGDGVHPNTYYSGGSKACVFTTKGLTYGYNRRNLITLEGAHRAKAAVDGKKAPDPAGPKRKGVGSQSDPVVIDALPFTDVRNTAGGPYKKIHKYPGCSATQDESGPEYIYRYKVTSPHSIRAMVFDRGSVDIDVHLLGATVSGASCIKRGHNYITASLKAGTYHFALDTFVKSGSAKAGEYLFVVLKE